MDISKYDLIIKRHVFARAMERGIHPDMIEDCIRKGKMDRFGKNGVKFISKGSKRTLVCVGELSGITLKIITIEEAKK